MKTDSSIEKNKALVRRFFAAIENADFMTLMNQLRG
jgi:hypothetical protein